MSSKIRASSLSRTPSGSVNLDGSTFVGNKDDSKLPPRHVPGPLRVQNFIISRAAWFFISEPDRREQYHKQFKFQWWMTALLLLAFLVLFFWAVPLTFVFVWRHGSLLGSCSGQASFDSLLLPQKLFPAQTMITNQELAEIQTADPGLKWPLLDLMVADPTIKYLEARLQAQTRKIREFNPNFRTRRLSKDLGELGRDLLEYRVMHNNLTNGICRTQDLATEAMVRFSEVLLPALGRDNVAELTSIDMLGLPIIPAIRILNRQTESPYFFQPNIFEFEVQNTIKSAHRDFCRSSIGILNDRVDILSSVSRKINVSGGLDSIQRQRILIPAPDSGLRYSFDLLFAIGSKKEKRNREEYLTLLTRTEGTLLEIQDVVKSQSTALQELQISDQSFRLSLEPCYKLKYSRHSRRISVPSTLRAEALDIPYLRVVDRDAKMSSDANVSTIGYYDFVLRGANVTATRFISDLLSLCDLIAKRDVVAVAFQPVCSMWTYFRDASTSTSDVVGTSWTSKKKRAQLWWNLRNNNTMEGTLKFLMGQDYYKHEAAARQFHLDQNRQAL